MMSDTISALKYLLDILLNNRSNSLELKHDVSMLFREAITEVEIYLLNVNNESERVREKENEIARMWSNLSAHCAPHDKDYSDTFLKISRCWANPDEIPIKKRMEYIAELHELLRKGREDDACLSAG